MAPALSPDQIALYARVVAMADGRSLDTAIVDSALASRWRLLRAATALAVGQVHGKARTARLRTLIDEPDEPTAANAAYALGLMRDSGSVDALARPRVGRVGAAAAWALGEIGEPARHVLETRLADSLADPTVMRALLLSTARLRPVPLESVEPHLNAVGSLVRWAAIYAIARQRVPAGVRALLHTLPRASADERSLVARALARQAAGDSLAPPALAALYTLVSDSEPHVRIEALRSLGTYGRLARDLIVAATRDRDPNVRVAAIQSAGAAIGPRASTWEQLWMTDTSFMFRRSLLASAFSTGIRPRATAEWLRSSDWRYRAAVAEAAVQLPQISRVRDTALPLTGDSDPRVREVAYSSLTPRSDTAVDRPWRHQALVLALADSDFYVRTTALDGLRPFVVAADVPAVLESYARAQLDSANDARVAAVRLLATAWRRDSLRLDGDARRKIASLPSPDEPLVRFEGAGVSLFSHWTGPPGRVRPLALYESIVRTIVVPSATGRHPRAEIVTERGSIRIVLFGADAPLTVSNFVALARVGFFRNTRFSRVVPNLVVQDGDPRGDGNGGPGYTIRDELNPRPFDRGAVGMAVSGPDTGGSQFFITYSRQPHLDGHYTMFARVVDGYDVLDRIVQGDRILKIRVQ